jgi:hypothetical protein
VEVGGAALDGVGEQGVDEADHRLGVFAPAGLTEGVGFAVSISLRMPSMDSSWP